MERVKSGTKPLFIIERSDAATDDLTEDWTVTSTNGITLDGSILDYANHTDTLDANAIPEPSAWALLTLGVCGLLCWRKRKN